jgi:hypothetical protein
MAATALKHGRPKNPLGVILYDADNLYEDMAVIVPASDFLKKFHSDLKTLIDMVTECKNGLDEERLSR